jgi:hypothetical protein
MAYLYNAISPYNDHADALCLPRRCLVHRVLQHYVHELVVATQRARHLAAFVEVQRYGPVEIGPTK